MGTNFKLNAMSDKELKDLVASLAVAQRQFAEDLAATQKEVAAIQKEVAVVQKEAAAAQKEAAAAQKEAATAQKEVAAVQKEAAAAQKETAKQIKQTQKQLGELGNKWGTFTEGMAIESIKKILFERFNISVINRNVEKRMNGSTIEMDAFGYENSTVNTAVIVEIKSHLRDDAIEQIERIMTDFPKFFPDHADKKLYGMIACVYAPDNIKNALRKKGIFLAVLHDEVFELYPFDNFTPKDFNHA
ncbi:MAG: DUF3782 domain-containing protein [Saprospiraceae bacterium]|nr:DUF3782 domain-containing protein [Saprospiraceae bacterium]